MNSYEYRSKFSDIHEEGVGEFAQNNYDTIDDLLRYAPQVIETSCKRRLKSQTNNRLSCEELENLKERFVDFIEAPDVCTKFGTFLYKQHKTSKSCAHLSSLQNKSSLSINRPDPPQRTVSIRHSGVYSSTSTPTTSNLPDDACSVKSIYTSSNSSSSCSTHSSKLNRSFYSIYDESSLVFKTEVLKENDMNRIEAMYKSVYALVFVSSCTVDVYTTNSEQISNLQEFWKLEFNSVVPVWIFDRRQRHVKLTLVDKQTAFPVCKQIVFGVELNQLKNPKDKRLTFTIGNLTFLIVFHDFFACNQFLKFYQDFCSYTNQVKENVKSNIFVHYRTNEFKQVQVKTLESTKKNAKISKNFISNPCGFQHVNSLKNDDKQVKLLLVRPKANVDRV